MWTLETVVEIEQWYPEVRRSIELAEKQARRDAEKRRLNERERQEQEIAEIETQHREETQVKVHIKDL